MKDQKAIYQLDGTPPLGEAAAVGMQHVLAMFAGNVAPIMIIAGMLKLPIEQKTFLIQCAMFVAGLVTLVQLYPIGPVGARLPIVMGTSFGFMPTCQAIASRYGLAGVLGASLIGGFFEVILGAFIRPLRKFFPPIVTGTVLLAIGLSLIPTGVKYFAGGVGAKDFGSAQNLLLGTLVVVIILVIKQFTKGITSISAILIGLVVGYLVAIPMGKVDFNAVKNAGWFSFPTPLQFELAFHWDAIVAMLLMYIVTAVETVGDISGICMGGARRQATDKELSGGVIADGLGSSFAALFGVLPNTSYSQNVGLVAITGVMNRFAVAIGAIFLVAAGLFPKIGAIVAIMPQSVLGGAALVMFSMITISGMQLVTLEPLNGKRGLVVAVALGLGFGLGSVPEALAKMPEYIRLIFGESGIVVACLVALVLNIVLPESAEEKVAQSDVAV